MTRRAGLAALTALLTASLLASATLLWGVRFVTVEGSSMSPALEAGDLVVAVVLPGTLSFVEPGDIVIASAPPAATQGSHPVVKRVRSISAGGESFELVGDNPEHSRDSRHYGALPRERVRGLVVWVVPSGDR